MGLLDLPPRTCEAEAFAAFDAVAVMAAFFMVASVISLLGFDYMALDATALTWLADFFDRAAGMVFAALIAGCFVAVLVGLLDRLRALAMG